MQASTYPTPGKSDFNLPGPKELAYRRKHMPYIPDHMPAMYPHMDEGFATYYFALFSVLADAQAIALRRQSTQAAARIGHRRRTTDRLGIALVESVQYSCKLFSLQTTLTVAL